MPVEGHLLRARTPLSARDRRLLGAALVVAVAAAVVAVLAFGRHHPAAAGCVAVDVPSTMGGATLRECGAAARRFCRAEGARDARIAAACRSQGFAADLP